MVAYLGEMLVALMVLLTAYLMVVEKDTMLAAQMAPRTADLMVVEKDTMLAAQMGQSSVAVTVAVLVGC